MDFEKLIRSRRTIHEFDPERRIEWAQVEHALENSLWALNHRLTFPWLFLRVGPSCRAKIADLSLRVHLEEKGLSQVSDVLAHQIRSRILNPSELIVLGLKRAACPDVELEDYATLGASVQIASLSLWKQGIGSKWSTGKVTKRPELYEILNLSQEEVMLHGFFCVGAPKGPPKNQSRPHIHQFLQTLP